MTTTTPSGSAKDELDRSVPVTKDTDNGEYSLEELTEVIKWLVGFAVGSLLSTAGLIWLYCKAFRKRSLAGHRIYWRNGSSEDVESHAERTRSAKHKKALARAKAKIAKRQESAGDNVMPKMSDDGAQMIRDAPCSQTDYGSNCSLDSIFVSEDIELRNSRRTLGAVPEETEDERNERDAHFIEIARKRTGVFRKIGQRNPRPVKAEVHTNAGPAGSQPANPSIGGSNTSLEKASVHPGNGSATYRKAALVDNVSLLLGDTFRTLTSISKVPGHKSGEEGQEKPLQTGAIMKSSNPLNQSRNPQKPEDGVSKTDSAIPESSDKTKVPAQKNSSTKSTDALDKEKEKAKVAIRDKKRLDKEKKAEGKKRAEEEKAKANAEEKKLLAAKKEKFAADKLKLSEEKKKLAEDKKKLAKDLKDKASADKKVSKAGTEAAASDIAVRKTGAGAKLQDEKGSDGFVDIPLDDDGPAPDDQNHTQEHQKAKGWFSFFKKDKE